MGLAEQYKEILNQNIFGVVAVFDYATDFYRFWNEKDDGDGRVLLPAPEIIEVASGSTQKALVIIWNDMPDDKSDNGKLLVSHLTPLDWALAFALRMLELEKVDRADFSIHIIDFTVKAYEDVFVSRVRDTLLAEMPWVTLYAPLVPKDKNGKCARYRRGFKHITELIPVEDVYGQPTLFILPSDVLTMANSLKGQEESVKQALGLVANTWRSSVIQSDDHHDLNNIVAPILMPIIMELENATSGNDKSIMTAFVHRLSWCGLLDLVTVEFDAPEFSTPLDIVAIDDQLAMGWDRVLGALVGIPPENVKAMPDSDQIEVLGSSSSVNLSGATDPNCLLKALGITQNADTVKVDINLYKKRKFDSPEPTDNDSRPWMLVLDLRLFSGKVSEERKWYRTLASAAIQIAEWEKKEKEKKPVGKDVLAWRGFDDIKQVEYLADDKNPCDEGHTDTELSLFARLCALRWPSVPIIVFSATGRRGLIAKLAEYGNIFLSSQKPNVLAGNQGEQVAAFTESWTRELQAALSLVDVQSSLLKLMNANNPVGKINLTQTNTHKHIIMALDEAGDFSAFPQSAIGGVMLVAEGKSKDDAIEKAYVFQEDLRKEGINFYDQPPYYTDWGMAGNPVNVPFINKKTNVSAMLATVVKGASTGITLSSFRYVIPIQGYTTNAYKDEAYLRGLTRCIEIATCEMLPSLGVDWEKNVTISAWFPTKQTSFSVSDKPTVTEAAQAEAEAAQAAMAYDFRLESFKSPLVEAIGGFGKAYSIFLSAIGGRGEFKNVMKAVVSLKSRKIPYNEGDNGYSPANDWYCKRCNMVERREKPNRSQAALCERDNLHTIADYSVMSHLADKILHWQTPPNAYIYKSELNADYSFDVMESVKLNDFLHTARLFDQEREIDGFKLAYKYDNFIEGMNEKGSGALAPIERKLIQKLKEFAPNLKGATLTELAGIRTRGIEAYATGVAANQNHKQKKNHPQKKKQDSHPISKMTPVNENIPLNENELRIIFKDSEYAVLARENGNPCGVILMANKKVAECEIGQIVVVKNMYSNKFVKVSHSEIGLGILDFVRRR